METPNPTCAFQIDVLTGVYDDLLEVIEGLELCLVISSSDSYVATAENSLKICNHRLNILTKK